MKTIGILGGMGWESSAIYYRVINQELRRLAGGFHSAHIVLESFDFAELTEPQERGDWESVRAMLSAGAQRLEAAGADFWLAACNTVHRVTDAVEADVGIPFLHIVDCAGEALAQQGVERVVLLGTRHTMQADFFPDRLKSRFGIDALVPDEDAQARIHGWILDELVHGVTTPEARSGLDEIAGSLAAQGAQATLLACTELGLLYSENELDAATAPKAGLPVFDTARLHALAAARLALSA